MIEENGTTIDGPVTIINPNEELAVLIEDSKKVTNGRHFTITWRLKDVFIYIADTDPYDPENQRDEFDEEITIKVQMTEDIIEYLDTIKATKEVKPSDLFLIYYNRGNLEWVEFNDQTFDPETNTCTAKLKKWIKDPPIGWGGDYPE